MYSTTIFPGLRAMPNTLVSSAFSTTQITATTTVTQTVQATGDIAMNDAPALAGTASTYPTIFQPTAAAIVNRMVGSMAVPLQTAASTALSTPTSYDEYIPIIKWILAGVVCGAGMYGAADHLYRRCRSSAISQQLSIPAGENAWTWKTKAKLVTFLLYKRTETLRRELEAAKNEVQGAREEVEEASEHTKELQKGINKEVLRREKLEEKLRSAKNTPMKATTPAAAVAAVSKPFMGASPAQIPSSIARSPPATAVAAMSRPFMGASPAQIPSSLAHSPPSGSKPASSTPTQQSTPVPASKSMPMTPKVDHASQMAMYDSTLRKNGSGTPSSDPHWREYYQESNARWSQRRVDKKITDEEWMDGIHRDLALYKSLTRNDASPLMGKKRKAEEAEADEAEADEDVPTPKASGSNIAPPPLSEKAKGKRRADAIEDVAMEDHTVNIATSVEGNQLGEYDGMMGSMMALETNNSFGSQNERAPLKLNLHDHPRFAPPFHQFERPSKRTRTNSDASNISTEAPASRRRSRSPSKAGDIHAQPSTPRRSTRRRSYTAGSLSVQHMSRRSTSPVKESLNPIMETRSPRKRK